MEIQTLMIILGILLACLLLSWVAILDIASKDFPSQAVKFGWGIAVSLMPVAGCVAYYLIGIRQGVRRKKTEAAEK